MTRRTFKPRCNFQKEYLTNTGQFPKSELQIPDLNPREQKARMLRIRQQWEDVLHQLDRQSTSD